jgi:Mrp family chromosome partitioning ATPase
MGKLLETLQQGGGRVQAVPEDAPPLPAPEAAGPEANGAPADEIPFIEVGGRRAPLEASPSVLASAPPAREATRTPAQPGPGPRLQKLDPPAAGPLSVLFRPLASGPVPARARFAPELVAFHEPEHPVSRQYHALADALAQQLPAGPAGTLLLTAARRGAGTTTVLLNLAITLARRGDARVLVVDAQRDQPAVAERLAVPSAPGLHEVLTGLAALPQAVQETGQERLSALTAGHARGRPGAWTADGLRTVARQLRERFELVLIDAPPWDGRPEVAALAAVCDGVYLVAPGGEDAATAELVRTLPRQGVPLRGQILTAAERGLRG